MRLLNFLKSNLLIVSAVFGFIGQDLNARSPQCLREENLDGALAKLMRSPIDSYQSAHATSKDDYSLTTEILKKNPKVIEMVSGNQVIGALSQRKPLPSSQEIEKVITKKSTLASAEHAEKLKNLAAGLQAKYIERPFVIKRKMQEVGPKLTLRTRGAFESLATSICDSIEKEVTKLVSTDFRMLPASEASVKGEEITALQMHLNNSSQGFDALVSAFDDKGGNNSLFHKILSNYMPIAEVAEESKRPTSQWTRFKNWMMSSFFG